MIRIIAERYRPAGSQEWRGVRWLPAHHCPGRGPGLGCRPSAAAGSTRCWNSRWTTLFCWRRVEARIKAGGVLRSDDTPETLAHRLGSITRIPRPDRILPGAGQAEERGRHGARGGRYGPDRRRFWTRFRPSSRACGNKSRPAIDDRGSIPIIRALATDFPVISGFSGRFYPRSGTGLAGRLPLRILLTRSMA